ncbi:MAG TPA: acetone carboxylase subunit gamma [Gemmatimonadaceae bacterium]|jgi:acetophenone carboxylase|nr:acetone carboxylase subunit gamma [Gemmatimonadaceae bacterium]
MELTMSLETQNRLRVTEYLDLDLDREEWKCNRCGHSLGSVRENYKKGCLVHDRDPGEIHPAIVPGPFNFSPDPLWVRIVEFYCPGCGTQVETEYLPPGHPITHDIEIDVEQLKEQLRKGEFVIRGQRLEVVE